ncbi:MAG: PDZ domain-containing protein [Acidobacteriota bacterium]|nr:MAG: PDZ domain-containing protein [Acidobacteriota bacterium]
MSMKAKLWVVGISGIVTAYAMVGGMPFVGRMLSTSAQQPVNDSAAQIRIVESVLQHIQNDYVDEPNMDKVRLGALRGLAAGLDPYSSFLTAEQVRSFNENAESGKVGIGAEFSQISGYLYVISAIKGSPAERAGLRSGDVIEYIDNKATRDISLYDARQLITGTAGTTVDLRVLRSGERPQTIKVVRGTYKVPPVETRVELGKIGVVRVYSLETGEAGDIKAQLDNFQKQGLQKVILDLRGVAAGTLQEGVAVANLFIREGELARVIGRDNKVVSSFSADPSKAVFTGELAVLIDNSSAGAAEVVASAVADLKRGEVIGERTFGAGTEQKLFTLKSGDGYLLTVAKWASPTGVPFLGEERATMGVKPTIEVKRPDVLPPLDVENLDPTAPETPQPSPSPSPAKKEIEDVQFKKAVEILLGADKAKAA